MTDKASAHPNKFDKLKYLSAELILSGFRRDTYAGVFVRQDISHNETHVCDLLLDGYERKIQIKVAGDLTISEARTRTDRPIAALHGLPLLLKPPKVELYPTDSEPGMPPHFIATVNLKAAVLRINVLPFIATGQGPKWLCVLEILREEAV